MTRIVIRMVFAGLVLATFGAFFVAARIKQAPPVISRLSFTSAISPDGDGTRDVARISFRVQESDVADIEIIDASDEVVRTLDADRRLRPGSPQRFRWNGRSDEGQIVADGDYRLRVVLRDEGRSVTSPRKIVVDTTPPSPRIARVTPRVASPDGDGRADVIRFRYRGPTGQGAGSRPTFIVYRTGSGRSREVARFRGRKGESLQAWDGQVDGEPAPPGNYLIAVKVRDAAGNKGTTPRTLPPVRSEADVPGKPGLRVRYLEARGPEGPVTAGSQVRFRVDTHRSSYRWAIRRLGAARPSQRGVSRARGDQSLRPPVPRRAGVFLLEMQSARFRYATPFTVRSTDPGRVLAVLPAAAWQATNALDTDGDGWGETLAADGAVGRDRPITGRGLPQGFRSRVQPVMEALSRARAGADVTTDIALARGQGPDPSDYRGMIFVGDERWFPPAAGRLLADAVRKGLRVAWVAPDAFHRQLELGETELRSGGRRSAEDPFGERTALEDVPAGPLEVARDDLGLFAEVVPSFGRFSTVERSIGLPEQGSLRSGAGPEEGGLAAPAYRFGKGIVIRLNPRGFAEATDGNGDVRRVFRRLVDLLQG